ncbi:MULTISPECIES: response regulator transcription factor [unclassified Janthinobacterium]|uniref:response regulator transcription factor n=1 Tax=unclassified Janthinobacterium TaxID=2610881 RepID=UPI00258F6F0F|nr:MULTISPECIES: response regulator [unclassified Janthinobacterium]MCX7292043.1 response regulator [Janthinobacterium sp.]MED5594123.1 response regulator [Janthinobacterium sp. P210006]
MVTSNLTVFIVDDDPAVRDALGLLLGIRGYRTALFSCGEDFLQGWRPEWAGCLLIDIRMSGMDGLSLQRRLLELECMLPIIIITGHGDVALARQAFKAQASDFLEKPFDHDKLLAAIDEAFSREAHARGQLQRQAEGQALLRALTPREREVMHLVVTGQHNRDIAPALGISVRTVEVHKARLMDKLGVDNVADLVRISMLGTG